MKQVTIYVDGAIAGAKNTGIAAVARTTDGCFLGWLSARRPRMTNNEAEYEAVLLGLDLAQKLETDMVEIISDSEVVVRQMKGWSRVNSARLKPLHRKTCRTTARFRRVIFTHVPREQNRLADALAAEALSGQVVKMRARPNWWKGMTGKERESHVNRN